jgi:DNA polymerase phi
MEMMFAASEPKSGMSGQEERDMYFARLFGLTSLTQSGLLTRATALSYRLEQPISSQGCFQKVIEELVVLSGKKSWMRESCWWSIGLALEKLHSSSVSWKEAAAKNTFSHLFAGAWTAEKLALALKLRPLYPNADWTNFLSTRFKGSEILSSKNFGVLVTILKVNLDLYPFAKFN